MDSSLAASLAADVDAAFPDLVAALAQPVYSVGLRLCGPPHAEDVAQDAFVRAYRALTAYSPERIKSLDLRPWVLTIALNVARNRLRTDERHPTVALESQRLNGVDHTSGPERAAERSALRRRLAIALARLPVSSREAVVLRHVVGCPVAEVAAILDRPTGTVKAQVARGLAVLRDDLHADRDLWENA